ncbi:hypothetical protein AV530_013544 [Patagioenas fasciata monilis]|uniref:Uncharacterized protein n=1 Tax=Patagioenas fasciata monilis TaxID=372326 RepID=A0A1V4JQ03_PATFA|nr:hypothetical protein AV530_013544 [Patagioenas fasciata monilis]
MLGQEGKAGQSSPREEAAQSCPVMSLQWMCILATCLHGEEQPQQIQDCCCDTAGVWTMAKLERNSTLLPWINSNLKGWMGFLVPGRRFIGAHGEERASGTSQPRDGGEPGLSTPWREHGFPGDSSVPTNDSRDCPVALLRVPPVPGED